MNKTYQIRVRGHLDHDWSAWFEGFRISHLPDGNTLLQGLVTDQAALHGVLIKIRNLGLPLVSVNPLDDPDGTGAPSNPMGGKDDRGNCF